MKKVGVLCLVIFCSCSVGENTITGSSDAPIQNTIENEYGSFVLSYESDTYNFVDEIEITLSLNLLNSIILPESLPEADTRWGDFLVRKKIVHSHESYHWILLPEKTGLSELPPLSFLITTGDNRTISLSFPPIQLNILSVLQDESGEPVDLIAPEEADSQRRPFLIFVVILFCLGILVTIGFFIFLKMKQKIKDPSEPGSREILITYSELITKDEFYTEEIKDQYRQVYHYLGEFFHVLCPAIPKGLDPNALIMELEKPSGLNQWALRTLYPLLNEMEGILFNPEYPEPSETVKNGHFNTIRECMDFLAKEEGSSNV